MKTGREGEEVDQCDYAYTIHGWIKGVQSQNFSYALGYYDEGANRDYKSITNNANLTAITQETSLYNGNISSMSTNTPAFARNGMTAEFKKQFTYDQLNRIKTGKVETSELPSGLPGGSNAGLPSGAFETEYSYDANGNITNLTRKDKSGNTFDEMAYNYHNVDNGYLECLHLLIRKD